MELFNITKRTTIKQLLKKACFDVSVMEVNDTEECENIIDQRVYATIKQSNLIFNTFLDGHGIERNIQWELSAEVAVWIDQQKCNETGQVICAQLDTELLAQTLSNKEISLFLDGSKIEEYEIEEIPLLQKLIASINLESLQKAIDGVYTAKFNMPHKCTVKATMKDNGEVFHEYYRFYSNEALQTQEHYQQIMKSLSFDSAYGACFYAADHLDKITGLLNAPYELIPFNTSDIDFDLGYSLIDVTVLNEAEHDALIAQNDIQPQPHVFESRMGQFQS